MTDDGAPAPGPPGAAGPLDVAGLRVEGLAVPAVVRRLAGGAAVEPVWRNEVGGTTFRVAATGGAPARYVKHAPPGAPLDLRAEARKLAWVVRWTPVPRVLDAGRTAAGEAWLVTQALDGESAVAPRWRARPAAAVAALGRGLRALHEALPVASCPFDWSVARRRIAAVGDVTRLPPQPPVDRLVVCHGDACSPNTLLRDDGRGGALVAGHVDLGALGVADRWADLAVATLATTWNYGPGWEDLLLTSYGVDPADPARAARTTFYRALWDVGP
ncbi:phosphotransferase [Kineococcus sp. SYSU DK004]|uniref:phosphotransferase n=1 Tax=Kineococcus sp. SYSU DK004 TaxID=3383125 RepID=UPI003D7D1395